MDDDRKDSSLFLPPSAQDHLQGMLSSVVIIVMYGDYECNQSANVYRLLKVAKQQMNDTFGEKEMCYVFRHFPQVEVHPHAQHAAEAAEAAEAQDLFWQMHEMLFMHQQNLGNGYLVEYANRLGLSVSKFLQSLYRGAHIDRINADIESGRQSGVEAVPALFINGVRYRDRWNIQQLMTAIVIARS